MHSFVYNKQHYPLYVFGPPENSEDELLREKVMQEQTRELVQVCQEYDKSATPFMAPNVVLSGGSTAGEVAMFMIKRQYMARQCAGSTKKAI